MPNTCVQTVQNWCTSVGKTCARLSTKIIHTAIKPITMWVQAQVIRMLHTICPTGFSTYNYATLPLLHNEFYPLSTAPTIITTKEIL